MWTKRFWMDAAERAVRTFAQALGGVLIGGVTIFNVDLGDALVVGGSAAVLSVLMSLGASTVGDAEDPSLIR